MNGSYALPFEQRSKMKWSMHLLFIFLIGIFGAFLFLPTDGSYIEIAFKLLCTILVSIFLYAWVFAGILRRQSLKITQDFIEFTAAFGTKKAHWNEIYDVQVFTQSHNTFIGLILKDKIRKSKQSFWTELNNMYGGMFSIRIPISLFASVDIETLYSTIRSQMNMQPCDLEFINKDSQGIEEQRKTNWLIVLLKISLLVLVLGIVYGISIYLLKINFLLIPIFGQMGIIYIYNKNSREEINVWPIRYMVGLLCASQIFIAMITSIFLTAKIPYNLRNLNDISLDYIMYIKDEPLKNLMVIGIAILLFAYGTFHGKTFRFFKIIGKIFMKRHGDYFYKRDGRIAEIYLINPEDFREDETKFVAHIEEGCLIEKEGKRVKALLLPKTAIEVLEIKISGSNIVQNGEEQYYKIVLGGTGSYAPYVFPCVLICSTSKEIELIRLEI